MIMIPFLLVVSGAVTVGIGLHLLLGLGGVCVWAGLLLMSLGVWAID